MLQEVSVAANVIVLHGGIFISWEIIIKVMVDLWHPHRRSILSYTSNPEMWTFYQTALSDLFENVCTMDLVREEHGKVESSNRLPLGILLACCLKFRSTDPRDKVFVLMGLAVRFVSLHYLLV